MIRMLALLSAALLASLLAQGPHQPHEGRVQKTAAGVDFTYHSHVDKKSNNKFWLTNFIVNNTSSPLSIEWKDAGIICVGTQQLPGGNMDKRNGSILGDPASIDSIIKYGVKLNYDAPAEVYIDPQTKTAKSSLGKGTNVDQTAETIFERRDGKNSVVYLIKVVSTLKKRGESELIFEVEGGLSLALAIDTRHGLGKRGWAFGEPMALPDIRFTNREMDRAIMEWVQTGGIEIAPDFFVLKNPGKNPIDFIGTVASGSGELRLKRINILGFLPNQPGFVGFDAAVYLPKDLNVR